jgi:hypothetical protein
MDMVDYTQQLSYYKHLHFKLALRKYLLKQRDTRATRGILLNNFRQVSLELLDEVITSCVAEGLITVTTGRVHKNVQVYKWNDSAVKEEPWQS